MVNKARSWLVENKWRDEAACRGMATEIFFPVSASNDAAVTAKAVCEGCPVTEECLSYAMAAREPEGVFGGLTPRQREALWRRKWQRRRRTA